MTITKTETDTELTLSLVGRLDTTTAKQLEVELPGFSGKSVVTLDFTGLQYVSSAGLRVLLMAYKQLTKDGAAMRLLGVNAGIKEVFEMTGFVDFLTLSD